jgi:hypothetical protein
MNKMMITNFRNGYILLLSYNPCDVFNYFDVEEMHGLSLKDCQAHENTTENAYIAGWSNFVPKASGEYISNDDRFVFINLSRCTDPVRTTGLIMHELMHYSFFLHNYNIEREEEIITWAEEESYKVYNIIKPMLGKVVKEAINLKSE